MNDEHKLEVVAKHRMWSERYAEVQEYNGQHYEARKFENQWKTYNERDKWTVFVNDQPKLNIDAKL